MKTTEESLTFERPSTVLATLIGVAVAGIVLILIKWASPIIAPIMLGFFLAALGRPAFTWLEERGWGKGWALLGVIGLLASLGGVLLLLMWLYVERLSSGLGTYRELLLSRFDLSSDMLATAQRTSQNTAEITNGGGMSTVLVAIVRALASSMGQLVFGFVLSIMLLVEWPRFGAIVRGVGSTQPFLEKLPAVASSAVVYFAVRAKINLITAVAVTIAFAVVGIDYPLLWGVVTFFLSFVPYVGIIVATAAPALLGFAELGWWALWYVIAIVTVLNLSIEYVIAPTMTGKSLSLSPTVVFVMFFFWSWMLGPVGMLISMPITVLLMLVFASDPGTLFLARLLGSGGEKGALPEPIMTAELAHGPGLVD